MLPEQKAMEFDKLTKVWQSEIADKSVLERYAIESLASEAEKIGREQHYTAIIFAALSLIAMLGGSYIFLFNVDIGLVPFISLSLLHVLGIPLTLAYASYMYFRAVRDKSSFKWTLEEKIRHEIEKLERQMLLYKKMPTHVLLPMFLILMSGALTNLINRILIGEPIWKLSIFIILTFLYFSACAFILNRSARNKLGLVRQRLLDIEDELKDEVSEI